MNTAITLSPSEMFWACNVGVMRQIENIRKGRRPRYGAGTSNDWQLHIEGSLGECALAKFLGVYWTGKGKLRLSDVGEFDVRTQAREDNASLILHPGDPDDRVFWLVAGTNGTYHVKGWMYGRDGKKPEYWKEYVAGRPAYFVPETALHSPELLIKERTMSK